MALTATAGSDTKRTIIVVIVALLHVGMYYVIESGLSHQIISMLAPPVETKIIEEVKPPEDLPPPPPPPDIAEPPPFIPPPEVTVQLQTQTTAIQVVTNEQPPAVVPPPVAPPAPAPVKPGTPVKRDVKRSKDPNDYYPSSLRRADETGVVQVRCWAGLDGKCTQASVTKSSGNPALDEAAIKYATEGLRVVPGTENGVPVAKWYDFLVSFKAAAR